MAKQTGFELKVTLIRGPGFPPEQMNLAEAVQAVVDSPVHDKLKDATIICEDMLIEGLDRIEAVYALPNFPKAAIEASETE